MEMDDGITSDEEEEDAKKREDKRPNTVRMIFASILFKTCVIYPCEKLLGDVR